MTQREPRDSVPRRVPVNEMTAARGLISRPESPIFRAMRRHWLRPLWTFLALLFLLEAWLWDHLRPLVAWVVDLVPWARLKQRLAEMVERLPPYAALAVFIVPFIVLLPLKFLEVYFLATRNWLGAALVLIAAKLLGLGVTAFVFDATRGKLLQMAWFRRMYDWFVWAREWAHAQTEPIRQRLQQLTWFLRPQRAGKFFRRLMRLRRRAYRGGEA
jgi:hypothetical protein